MALIACPDCGEPVSDSAVACLKCGCVFRPAQSEMRRVGGRFEMAGGGLIAAAMVLGLMGFGAVAGMAFLVGCGLFLYGRCS